MIPGEVHAACYFDHTHDNNKHQFTDRLYDIKMYPTIQKILARETFNTDQQMKPLTD